MRRYEQPFARHLLPVEVFLRLTSTMYRDICPARGAGGTDCAAGCKTQCLSVCFQLPVLCSTRGGLGGMGVTQNFPQVS